MGFALDSFQERQEEVGGKGGLSVILTEAEVSQIKHTPKEDLAQLGFSSADELLSGLNLSSDGAGHYMSRIKPIKPIFPGTKTGDRHPGGKSTPDTGDSGGGGIDIEDVLDLSDEAKEFLKTALAVAAVVALIGVCATQPGLLPAAARAISIFGPRLAPAMF